MNKDTHRPIVLIGGGGHAAVLADILLTQGREILALISPDDATKRPIFRGIPAFERNEDILKFDKDEILLVNGIGMMPRSCVKREVNEYFLSLGYQFETVIADSAIVSIYSEVEAGAQVFPMAIVQAGSVVGCHCIINTGALVEHDCKVGAYTHVAPNAVLCGQVETKEDCYIGAGSTVIQGLSIGRSAIVGAGASLTRSLDDNSIAYPVRATITADLDKDKGGI